LLRRINLEHSANPWSRNGRQPSPPPCDHPKTSLKPLITSAKTKSPKTTHLHLPTPVQEAASCGDANVVMMRKEGFDFR
jgi:hypothetical protein